MLTKDQLQLLGQDLKIDEYPIKKLEMDLAKFLPKYLRNIVPSLKQKTLEGLRNIYNKAF